MVDASPPPPSGGLVWTGVAVVLTVAAAVAVSYGLAMKDRVWLLVGAVVFAPLLVASAHRAADRLPENRRSAAAAAIAALCVLFIVTIVVTTPWWEKPRRATGRELFIASSDPHAHVYLHENPGGPELTGVRAPDPLQGGRGYEFLCEVRRRDSSRWLRVSDTKFWVPANALRTSKGIVPAPLPSC